MTATYDSIANITLSSDVSAVTFSGISSTYTDLVLVCSARTSGVAAINFQVNSDTASNYSFRYLQGNGSAASSAGFTNTSSVQGFYTTGAPTATSTFGTYIINFNNYSNTTTYKTFLSRESGNATTVATVGLWRSTSAINTIKLYPGGANFTSGSTFSIYGIKAE
jgi:hypothetical protein